MGSTCGSTRRELRFCHRCPRGFSSCKVVVKGFRSFFFFSRLYHPLPRPFSADITCRLFPFARVLPFMLVCTFSLASRFLFASTLFFRFFFFLAFSSFFTCQSLVPSRSLLIHQNRFHPPFCHWEYLTFVLTVFPLFYLQTRFISSELQQYIFI